MGHRLSGLPPAFLALVLSTGLAACGKDAKRHEMPPPLVEVESVRTRAMPETVELPGRIAAFRTAEVRARVDGIVERRLYREGGDVAAGAPLFRLDGQEAAAQLAEAQAALHRAEATRAGALRLVDRYAPLVADNVVSATTYDQARVADRQAAAAVGEARARLARARLMRDRALVRAPIAGRAGIARVTEGALASGAAATLLTTIDQIGTVYALFAAPRGGSGGGSATGSAGPGGGTVRLMLEDGSLYPTEGVVDFTSPTIDPDTGNQLYRAIFRNPERRLLPGQFVRVRLSRTVAQAIVIPAAAVQIGGGGASVYVVGADGTLATRPVRLGRQAGEGWTIDQGLHAGERIVVAGWQKAQPGQAVRIKGAAIAMASAGQERR